MKLTMFSFRLLRLFSLAMLAGFMCKQHASASTYTLVNNGSCTLTDLRGQYYLASVSAWYTYYYGGYTYPGDVKSVTLPHHLVSVPFRWQFICSDPGYSYIYPDTPPIGTSGYSGPADYYSCANCPGGGAIDDQIDNGKKDPCKQSQARGMAVWSVSEPYISLWLRDEPLGYQPALGPRISFELSYGQRESIVGLNTNLFSVGKKWNNSWLSFIRQDTLSRKLVYFPGGGRSIFSGTNDYRTNTRLTGDTTNGFALQYPDGSKLVYGFVTTNGSGVFQGRS